MSGRHRWLTPAALAVVGLVIVANAGSTVGLGLSGKPLVVTTGVALYAVSALVFLLWHDAPQRAAAALLLTMAAASVISRHGDPTGTGGIGLYVGMVYAPLRLRRRTAVAVALLSALAFDVHLALEAPNPFVFIAVVDGGCAMFFLLGSLLRDEHEQRTRADRLVLDLERSRAAERAAAAQAERGRLAREIHDVLAHTLSGLVVQLEAGRLGAVASGAPADVTTTLDRSLGLARDGLRDARRAVLALRGDDPGPDALPALVADHGRAPGAGRATFEVTGEPVALPPEARLAVFRTAQEALSNVRKHAPGADVTVRLDWAPGEAVLAVVDSGGHPHAALGAAGSGYGLAGMRERAALLGGDLVAAPHDDGFEVSLRIPVQRGGAG